MNKTLASGNGILLMDICQTISTERKQRDKAYFQVVHKVCFVPQKDTAGIK